MQIADVHNLKGFSSCRLLPCFIWLLFDYVLQFCSDVSFEVLFGAKLKFVTDFMRIDVSDPDRVDDGINHLSNCPFTNNFILNVFLFTVLKSNAR